MNVAVKISVDDDDLALVLAGARAIVVAFLEDDRLWLIREKKRVEEWKTVEICKRVADLRLSRLKSHSTFPTVRLGCIPIPHQVLKRFHGVKTLCSQSIVVRIINS